MRVYVCAYTYQWLSICGEVVLWWTVSKTSLVSVLVPFVLWHGVNVPWHIAVPVLSVYTTHLAALHTHTSLVPRSPPAFHHLQYESTKSLVSFLMWAWCNRQMTEKVQDEKAKFRVLFELQVKRLVCITVAARDLSTCGKLPGACCSEPCLVKSFLPLTLCMWEKIPGLHALRATENSAVLRTRLHAYYLHAFVLIIHTHHFSHTSHLTHNTLTETLSVLRRMVN